MSKLRFVVMAVLVAVPAVFLIDWNLSTALHVSTGFIAGIFVFDVVKTLRERANNEPR